MSIIIHTEQPLYPHLHIQKQIGTSRTHKDDGNTKGVTVLADEKF